MSRIAIEGGGEGSAAAGMATTIRKMKIATLNILLRARVNRFELLVSLVCIIVYVPAEMAYPLLFEERLPLISRRICTCMRRQSFALTAGNPR